MQKREGTLTFSALWLSAVLGIGALLAPGFAAAQNEKNKRLIEKPKEGTYEAVVVQAIKLAVADNFDGYWALFHPNAVVKKEDHLKYNWPVFKKWAPGYLVEGKEETIENWRQDPPEIKPDTNHVKAWFKSTLRDNSAPIELEKHDGKWYLMQNSL